MATVELCITRDGEFVTASVEDLPRLLASDIAFVWIDANPARPDEIEFLQEHLDLPRIAVDNAIDGPGRPRIMLFDDQIYVRSFGLRSEDGQVLADPISLFRGERFLVTARAGKWPSLTAIQDRWREEVGRGRNGIHAPGGPGDAVHGVPASAKLLYTVLDDLVDDYFTVIEGIVEEVEALEDSVMEDIHAHHHFAIQDTRVRINRLRRMLSPQLEVFNTLMRRDAPVIDEAIIPYFADTHDHLLRCHEWLDACRDQIASIVDLRQSIQANQLNRTMRTLTSWSIILMACGLIAGIYGMNFRHMPELGWSGGYPLSLVAMVVISGVLAMVFHRLRWW